ncbi:MAG: response regulator [bacterium]
MEKKPLPSILLIEDEPMISELYSAVLGVRPYQLFKAFNKTSAIELITEHKPHLILLDLMIPIGRGEDLISYDHPVGFDILEWVHHHPEMAHTKIVVLTNLESDEFRDHAEKLGAVAYLIKAEHEPHDILAQVDLLLGQE